ncbi:hypothetical protein QS445_25705, partial [Escherichia coli]|nr:hypothetical protein [Escherichia coli]
QNDVTLKMPAFEWVHVQLHQQKGMISLSPPTICNSALLSAPVPSLLIAGGYHASKSMGVPLHMEDLATGTHPVVLMLAEKGMNITVDHADYVWFVAPDTTKR